MVPLKEIVILATVSADIGRMWWLTGTAFLRRVGKKGKKMNGVSDFRLTRHPNDVTAFKYRPALTSYLRVPN